MNKNKVKTHADIIELWPSMRVLAEDIGESIGNVTMWKVRNSIPAHSWVRLVKASQDRDIFLSYRILAEAAAKK